ncbi:SDR family oxidoreductase [Actinokineospora sp. NBRC 105648]|uniref:SDR family NAD(P)-dependent oxidoreductase n=1 Tax=Actinokineospora sp. NBRC 105648 TaxID=3032206 RepID=UPI0024A2CCA6|nr:SDR family oxidoreductase [Actinokineospora sp. NBRC 105648]GLZ36632.1 beta-ketoacyl-ACP reductase [Actinokineospora sp. NBRC 105648]
MDWGVRDRTVLVTGGGKGIGLAVARAFHAEGARVALTWRSDEEVAARVAAELGERACHVRYALDEPGSPDAAVAEVCARWGGVDVLVANALVRPRRRGPGERFEDFSPDEWEPLLSNVSGVVRTVQAVLGGMRERGWGRIVLVSSHVAVDGKPRQEIYGAVKMAMHGLMRSLTWDVGGDGVLVNVVSPGLTVTEGVVKVLPEVVREEEVRVTPTGRLSTPEEVAAAVLFLGSGANGNVSGEVLTVAGGQ